MLRIERDRAGESSVRAEDAEGLAPDIGDDQPPVGGDGQAVGSGELTRPSALLSDLPNEPAGAVMPEMLAMRVVDLMLKGLGPQAS